MYDSILTLDDAARLGDLIRAVETGAKLRYYPFGADSADQPATGVLRAFTREGGGFIDSDSDVRGAYVHVSGMFERWYPVGDLIRALANMDGRYGLDQPIAAIDW